MAFDEPCLALLRHCAIGIVRCERAAGHDRAHSGSVDGSSFTWSDPDADGVYYLGGVVGPSDAGQRASYAAIPVDCCIVCGGDDPETVFVFIQPRGLQVAVPGRVGLCAECHRLLRGGDFQRLLVRMRGTDFEDFSDDAVLELMRAMRTALPA